MGPGTRYGRAWSAPIAACMALTGCVSSTTWRAWQDIDDELDRAEREEGEAERRATSSFADCAELARTVVAAHPASIAAHRRARAALADAASEGALPPPTLRLEVWDFPIGDPSLADREGMYMLGLAQELPPAGELDGEARGAVEEARAALGELDDVRRELATEAVHECAAWSASTLRITRLEAYDALLSAMREALIATLPTSATGVADVARLDVERARTARMRREAMGERETALASLRAMLGVEAGAALGDAPVIDASPVDRDAAALREAALARRGALRSARARADAASARADAAEASATVPTFMLGATYMQAPQGRAGMGLEVSMTLPWLWSRGAEATEAARSAEAAAASEARAEERAIEVELARAISTVDAIEGTLRSLREDEAPAARRALDASTAALRAGSGSVLEWLDSARGLAELEVEEARLLGELAHARAELSGVTGLVLEEGAGSGTEVAR